MHAAISCVRPTPHSSRSCTSACGRHVFLNAAAWSGDAPSAISRPLYAAYLPVGAGGRAAGPDPKRKSGRENLVTESSRNP